MQKTQVSAKSVHLQIFTLAILTLCHNEAQAKNDISRGAYLSQATSIGSPYFPKNDLYSTRQKLTLPSANQNKENNVLPNSRGPDCNAFFTAAGSNAVGMVVNAVVIDRRRWLPCR